MKRNAFVFALVAIFLELLPGMSRAQEDVLYRFTGRTGIGPTAGLIFDTVGDLYGTTFAGGAGHCTGYAYDGCGTVFELVPNGSGGWTEKVLYNFADNGIDGINPYGGLVFDAAGNLYGTTEYGGTGTGCDTNFSVGCGTVFKLSPQGNGRWRETILHDFQNDGVDGFDPMPGLTIDPSGNLYGTTYSGGSGEYAYGTVFQLTPSSSGTWTETVIHTFDGCCNIDGIRPVGSVILDSSGNLYGTTLGGGEGFGGTAFELTPVGDGSWTETILYYFAQVDAPGGELEAGFVMDAAGNLYGSAFFPSNYADGTVFELSPSSTGLWTETTLYIAKGSVEFQPRPYAGLTFDAAGNLYGCMSGSGSHKEGFVFELTPDSGKWNSEVLYNFGSNRQDGTRPVGTLLVDASGNIYGTTSGGGGPKDYGTVFEIVH